MLSCRKLMRRQTIWTETKVSARVNRPHLKSTPNPFSILHSPRFVSPALSLEFTGVPASPPVHRTHPQGIRTRR